MKANSRYNRLMPSNDKFDHLIDRLEGLLDRVERLTPANAQDPDWSSAYAFRWRKRRGGGYIQAVTHPHCIRLDDLQDIDRQRDELERNTDGRRRQGVYDKQVGQDILSECKYRRCRLGRKGRSKAADVGIFGLRRHPG